MLQIGSLVDGKYKILSEIGHGGMSVVYMAINEKANKTWAVKEVRKDSKMDFNTVRQGLIAETETLKKLSHPNLPSIIDVIEDDNSFIIVMDYIEGRSLDKIMAETGAQPEASVVKWAKQLCDVFEYLHSRTPPIIYRDMKPANIMLKPNGDVMVIDFGTAKNYEIDLGETTGIGTIGYAAPEQYTGSGLGRTDARTDIYCLGTTLYHLLTNDNPCNKPLKERSIREINPALSRGLDSIISKCTKYKPEDRYQSCAELMYDLQNYERIEPLYKRKQKCKLTAFLLVIAAAVVFALCGGALNIFASNKATDSYDTLLRDAASSTDYDEKIELYQECIEIPDKAGEKEAYLELINTFKSDVVFSEDESKLLKKLIKNNEDALMSNTENYTEICFEVGKLYWYYYNYGSTQGDESSEENQITRATNSTEWFQAVIDYAPKGYKNLSMARVYADIGVFYRDITLNIKEADDSGKYKPFFENTVKLVDEVIKSDTDNREPEIVKLELVELARSSIQQYATKLKNDGVSMSDVSSLYNDIYTALADENSDYYIKVEASSTTEEKRDDILKLMEDTKKTYELVYGSGDTEGGDNE